MSECIHFVPDIFSQVKLCKRKGQGQSEEERDSYSSKSIFPFRLLKIQMASNLAFFSILMQSNHHKTTLHSHNHLQSTELY
jgi:hypothetical protein